MECKNTTIVLNTRRRSYNLDDDATTLPFNLQLVKRMRVAFWVRCFMEKAETWVNGIRKTCSKGASAVYALQDGGGGKVIGDRDISVTRNGVVWLRGNCGKVVIVYVQRT